MPELLDQTNHVAWFDAGATIFSPKGIQYLGVPGLINAKNIIATVAVQVSSYLVSSLRTVQYDSPEIIAAIEQRGIKGTSE